MEITQTTPLEIKLAAATTAVNRSSAMAYGFNFSEQDIIDASKYALLVVDLPGNQNSDPNFYAPKMAAVKALNPSIKILGYKMLTGIYEIEDDWNECDAHEDWFLHDANGARVRDSSGWGFWLTDVGNAGYRLHLADYFQAKLFNYAAYDGVFLDNCWDTMYDTRVPQWKIDAYHSDVSGALQFLMDRLTPLGKWIMINTEQGWLWGHTNLDYVGIVNGMMIENFAHGLNDYNFGDNTIECLSKVSAMQKVCLAESVSASADVIDFCFNAFLMGINGPHALFGFNLGVYYSFTAQYPQMQIDVGEPLEPRQIDPATGIYTRHFSKGLSVLDPINKTGVFTPISTQKYFVTASVSPATAGNIALLPLQPSDGYDLNTWVNVTVYPTANSGLVFEGWNIDGTLMKTPALSNDVYMNQNHTVIAVFVGETPPPPPPNKSLAARVPMIGNRALVQVYLRRLRDRVFSKKLHKLLHPLI